MIDSSFCFLPGVGAKTERRLWRQGIRTWTDFISRPSIRGIGPARKALYDEQVRRAVDRHVNNDARYFGVLLGPTDHWRLYEWLRSRALYLDIETDSRGQITVVGLYGRGRLTSLIHGESLHGLRLAEEVREYDLLITFCGSTFDLPMLLGRYPDLPLDQPHIDLCPIGRRLGYRGGLKAIESQIGISRPSALQGLNGTDAVQLWNRWRYSRDERARARLLGYNGADCVNLERMAEVFYTQLKGECDTIQAGTRAFG